MNKGGEKVKAPWRNIEHDNKRKTNTQTNKQTKIYQSTRRHKSNAMTNHQTKKLNQTSPTRNSRNDTLLKSMNSSVHQDWNSESSIVDRLVAGRYPRHQTPNTDLPAQFTFSPCLCVPFRTVKSVETCRRGERVIRGSTLVFPVYTERPVNIQMHSLEAALPAARCLL